MLRRWPLFLAALLAAFVLASCAGDGDDDDEDDDSGAPGDDTDDADDGFPAGLYDVEGSDSVIGGYAGTVEVRPDGETPNLIRLVRFPGETFPDPRLGFDYEVHSAWTGAVTGGDAPTALVTLKVADFIQRYGDLERAAADGTPVPVVGTIEETGEGAYRVTWASDPGAPRTFSAEETWTYAAPTGATPTFVGEDLYVPAHAQPPETLQDLVNFVLADYHKLPFFDPYRDREDFQAGVHYLARFRTDFDWYRANPRALRVVNKWVDAISLAEAMLRARSFGPTLGEKAERFDAEMPAYYLNAPGFFSDALWGSDPLVQAESGDSLLWTGCYLASQVFRWQATGDEEALANWLRTLDALFLAHDIVQDVTSFARAVRPHREDGAKEWVHADPPYEAYDWLCCGNNDMIQGLYYGYVLSWLYLPRTAEYDALRAKIAERAVRLADYATESHDAGFNEIKANWLAFLTTGETRHEDRYRELWNTYLRFWPGLGNGLFYLWGISDWSGQHLDTIGHLILQFLATGTGDQDAEKIVRDGWENGMKGNPWTQTLYPIAAHGLGRPGPEFAEILDDAMWRMREFPYPKQSLAIDRTIDPAWCPSPLPDLPWKLDWMQGERIQGIWGVPLYERMHENLIITAPSDWRLAETDWTSGGGADFLHAYWLGRVYGVIGAQE